MQIKQLIPASGVWDVMRLVDNGASVRYEVVAFALGSLIPSEVVPIIELNGELRPVPNGWEYYLKRQQ